MGCSAVVVVVVVVAVVECNVVEVGGSLGAPKSGSLRAPESGSLGTPKSDIRDIHSAS